VRDPYAALRVLLLGSMALAACGRIGFDAVGAGDARTGPDAFDFVVLDPPFGTPTPVTDLNTSTALEDDPTLTEDMLEIYFSSTRGGGAGNTDIWTSTRASLTDPWQAPHHVVEINTVNNESNAGVSRDGLILVYGSGVAGNHDLYVVTRAARTDSWGVPTVLAALNQSGTNDFGAAINDSLDAVYYSSARSGNLDMYIGTGAPGAWASPTVISELATPSLDSSPFIMSDDDTVLWFASDRPGTAGGEDIWVAVRDSAGGPFGAPVRITELATALDDTDPWLSPDGHTIYFARTTSGTDLMMATR
jgi:hypothetical protein